MSFFSSSMYSTGRKKHNTSSVLLTQWYSVYLPHRLWEGEDKSEIVEGPWRDRGRTQRECHRDCVCSILQVWTRAKLYVILTVSCLQIPLGWSSHQGFTWIPYLMLRLHPADTWIWRQGRTQHTYQQWWEVLHQLHFWNTFTSSEVDEILCFYTTDNILAHIIFKIVIVLI